MKLLLLLVALLFSFSSTAHALSNLQLGISGGTYVNETTVANSNVFDLYAYLVPNSANTVGDTYYLSAALIKQGGTDIGKSSANLGSFKIGSSIYYVTDDMIYGVPPLDALYPDLGPHGIFPTWYTETAFRFDAGSVLSHAINVADGETQKSAMYQETFAIDLSGLNDGYGIHFDIYNLNLKRSRDYDLSEFAPYSHDAEGWKQPANPVIPEPGTVLLLGSGFLGLAIYGRRRKNS